MLNTAIVGAGPYGLSIAAHFRRRGIPFRIFGRPMESWLAHMPKGMMLKSDGFASNIYDPESALTVLSSNFESSVPGLYFAGVSAANSFGPVMRFAFGAGFAARTLTRALEKLHSRTSATVSVCRAQ
jgi:hypothetical protein